MVQFENDPERIQDAFNKQLITPEDYKKWQGLQGYSTALNKSLANDKISNAIFKSEQKNIQSFSWQRDFSEARLKFKLVGNDFNPINVLDASIAGNDINKSKDMDLINVWAKEYMAKRNKK